MDLFNRVKELASQHHMSIRGLEEHLGYGNGTINRWKKTIPGTDKVEKVADYFHVSTDYLLGRTDQKNISDQPNNEVDIEDDNVIMTYEGKPIPPEDLEVIKRFLIGGKRRND